MHQTKATLTAPAEIFLQVSDEHSDQALEFPVGSDSQVTWSRDPVTACHIPYVRADLAARAATSGVPVKLSAAARRVLSWRDVSGELPFDDKSSMREDLRLLDRELEAAELGSALAAADATEQALALTDALMDVLEAGGLVAPPFEPSVARMTKLAGALGIRLRAHRSVAAAQQSAPDSALPDVRKELPTVARIYTSGVGRRYRRASTRPGPGDALCLLDDAKAAIRRREDWCRDQLSEAARREKVLLSAVEQRAALPEGGTERSVLEQYRSLLNP